MTFVCTTCKKEIPMGIPSVHTCKATPINTAQGRDDAANDYARLFHVAGYFSDFDTIRFDAFTSGWDARDEEMKRLREDRGLLLGATAEVIRLQHERRVTEVIAEEKCRCFLIRAEAAEAENKRLTEQNERLRAMAELETVKALREENGRLRAALEVVSTHQCQDREILIEHFKETARQALKDGGR